MYVPILEGSSLSDVNKKRTDNSNGLSGVKSYFDIVDLKSLRDMVQEVKQKKEEAKAKASATLAKTGSAIKKVLIPPIKR